MGRRRIIAVVALGVLQLVVLVSLAIAGPDDRTHGAPIRVVAPPVVATVVVAKANDLPGHPVDARTITTVAAAKLSVSNGSSVAAVVVDLGLDTDVVYVSSANGTELNRAVQREVQLFEQSFGRAVVIRDLAPARSGDAGARGVYLLVGVLVLLGFGVPIVITGLWGSVARTGRRSVIRLAIVLAGSVVLGAVLGIVASLRYDSGVFIWSLISMLTILAIATTTLALESVFGVLGIGVATAVFVLGGAPLMRLTHPLLLPQPWSAITPWLPHGAALEAGRAQAYFGGTPDRPLLILAVWSLLAIMTIAVARRERDISA